MKTTKDDLVALIRATLSTWSGADWTHTLRVDGRDVSRDGVLELCAGDGDTLSTRCERCVDAASDAAGCEDLARDAIEALGRGDLDWAADLLRTAADVEVEWDDFPIWGPAADLAADLVNLEAD